MLDYKVIGLEALLNKLRPETIRKPTSEGIKKVALWTIGKVKISTPVDTGRLRSSIASEVIGQTARIGTNVNYAPFVEYGTKFMEARYVQEGSSARILGTGPFTRVMELLKDKIKDFIDEIGEAISARFG
jgi:phage gpG-like protein